jgi:hypothetical protein
MDGQETLDLNLAEQTALVCAFDAVFVQVYQKDYTPAAIIQVISEIGVKVLDEALVRAFIDKASVEGVRGFLKSVSNLCFDFSLEDLSRKLICNNEFSDPNIPADFWTKRIHLFKAFPCRESLYDHLKKLQIIPVSKGGDSILFSDGANTFLMKIRNCVTFCFVCSCDTVFVDKITFHRITAFWFER